MNANDDGIRMCQGELAGAANGMDGEKQDCRCRPMLPGCPPWWRSEDAHRLLSGERPEWSLHGDPYIDEYVAFLGAIHSAHTEQAREAVRRRWPVTSAAHEIHLQDDITRWLLESYVVAGLSDQEVSARCHVAAEVVLRYTLLFLDVRDALGTVWLVNTLVGAPLWDAFRDDEVRPFWAWCAMAGGQIVVDYLARTLQEMLEPNERPHLGAYLRLDVEIDSRLQALIAGRLLPVCEAADRIMMTCRLRLIAAGVEHAPDRREFMREQVRQHIICCARRHLMGKPLPKPRWAARRSGPEKSAAESRSPQGSADVADAPAQQVGRPADHS